MSPINNNAWSGLGSDLLNHVRDNINERCGEAAYVESINGIQKATAALYEAKVKDDKIIFLLQKYWDLRQSEAQFFLDEAKTNEKET